MIKMRLSETHLYLFNNSLVMRITPLSSQAKLLRIFKSIRGKKFYETLLGFRQSLYIDRKCFLFEHKTKLGWKEGIPNIEGTIEIPTETRIYFENELKQIWN